MCFEIGWKKLVGKSFDQIHLVNGVNVVNYIIVEWAA